MARQTMENIRFINRRDLMMAAPVWTSERLVYRITSRADAENALTALSDSETSESIYWVPKPYTMADADKWIARAERGWLSGEEFLFSAFLKDDYVGSINLHAKEGWDAEIGYWVASAIRGQGFATEMVAFIIGFCSSTMQVSHLFATTDTKNIASQKVLKKNGFQKLAGIEINSRASFLFERAMTQAS